MRRVVYDKTKPWLLILEFPCHADAKAAQELLDGQLTEQAVIRPKHFHPSDGNIATWRSTIALRLAFGHRDFRYDDAQNALLAAGYNDSGRSWLQRAYKYGVLERVAKGLYRFPPPTAANQLEMPCATLAPR